MTTPYNSERAEATTPNYRGRAGKRPDGRTAPALLAPVGTQRGIRPPRRGRESFLGEELILFRDGNGGLGLWFAYPLCCQSPATTLYYGRSKPRYPAPCLLYHGWLFRRPKATVSNAGWRHPSEPTASCQKVRPTLVSGRKRYVLSSLSRSAGEKPVLPRY